MLTAILATLIVICLLLLCAVVAAERLLGVVAHIQSQQTDTYFKNAEKIDGMNSSIENINMKLDPIYSIAQRIEKERYESERNTFQQIKRP